MCELGGSGGTTSVIATNTFGINGLVSRNDSSGTSFYAFDPQGSTAERVDSSGALVSSDCYNAWGTASTTASAAVVFGYIAQWGYYTDAETGLVLCTHRYYDPARGRWLNRDPIGYVGGIDVYAYCQDEPIESVDPSGLFAGTIPVIIVIVGGGPEDPVGDVVAGIWISVGLLGTYIILNTRRSGKEKASDCPSWWKPVTADPGNGRKPDESCQEWAARILNLKYGAGNWGTGGGSEYSQIVKYCSRNP